MCYYCEWNFIVRAEVIPGPDNGAINVAPESHFGNWRRPVGAGTPLGGGHRDTGWYRVVGVRFPSREAAALALGSAVWGDDDPQAEGEAILAGLGY